MTRSQALLSCESSKGLRQFFAWLESWFGGLMFDQGPAAEVIQVTHGCHLQAQDLNCLIWHDATALHVKNFSQNKQLLI